MYDYGQPYPERDRWDLASWVLALVTLIAVFVIVLYLLSFWIAGQTS